MSDGIEIHFDETHGYLNLACEPEAFAPYREIAREQLADLPEISVDKVIEISIVDTATCRPTCRSSQAILGNRLYWIIDPNSGSCSRRPDLDRILARHLTALNPPRQCRADSF